MPFTKKKTPNRVFYLFIFGMSCAFGKIIFCCSWDKEPWTREESNIEAQNKGNEDDLSEQMKWVALEDPSVGGGSCTHKYFPTPMLTFECPA